MPEPTAVTPPLDRQGDELLEGLRQPQPAFRPTGAAGRFPRRRPAPD